MDCGAVPSTPWAQCPVFQRRQSDTLPIGAQIDQNRGTAPLPTCRLTQSVQESAPRPRFTERTPRFTERAQSGAKGCLRDETGAQSIVWGSRNSAQGGRRKAENERKNDALRGGHFSKPWHCVRNRCTARPTAPPPACTPPDETKDCEPVGDSATFATFGQNPEVCAEKRKMRFFAKIQNRCTAPQSQNETVALQACRFLRHCRRT